MNEQPAPVPWEAPPEPGGPAPGVEFAGHGARLVAYILDSLIVSIVVVVIIGVAAVVGFSGAKLVDDNVVSLDPGSAVAFLVFLCIAFVFAVLYFPFFWARGGQTPGMRPFGLRVVRDLDGTRIGWGTALLRLVGLYVAAAVLYLGFIWIFIDKRRRGWQDLIAGTVVVKRP
jgi:uncharacterized RDD family membrane protein YckC